MTETQHTIASWADETFGPVSSLESIADRAMVEMRELVEKCRALDVAGRARRVHHRRRQVRRDRRGPGVA